MAAIAELPADSVSDKERFFTDVVERCKPLVLRGLCQHWPVVGAAADGALAPYIGAFDRGEPGEAFIGDAAIAGSYSYGEDLAGFNFTRERLTISQALARIEGAAAQPGNECVYLGSLPTRIHLPGFAEDNAMPLLPANVQPRVWLGSASRIACHYDTMDNLACVAAGRRRFTLYPPDAIGDLYVGPIDHTMAGQPISLAAGSAPGDPRYPRFAAAQERALAVELEPGDALYLPKLWWHQVEALSGVNLLVNYWWDAFSSGPDAPSTTMMLAMIAIAERPEAERAAWRAYFDHYVFRPHGHPLGHLPPERHGILGSLSSGNYGRIRAMVMQLLRGG